MAEEQVINDKKERRDLRRITRVKAARFLAEHFPDKYYLTYNCFGSLCVWERTGGILDWLLDSID